MNFPTILQDSEIWKAVSVFVLKDIFNSSFRRLCCASKGSDFPENFSRVRAISGGRDELCDVPLVHGVTGRVQVPRFESPQWGSACPCPRVRAVLLLLPPLGAVRRVSLIIKPRNGLGWKGTPRSSSSSCPGQGNLQSPAQPSFQDF